MLRQILFVEDHGSQHAETIGISNVTGTGRSEHSARSVDDAIQFYQDQNVIHRLVDCWVGTALVRWGNELNILNISSD